jgi:hypothetical protein
MALALAGHVHPKRDRAADCVDRMGQGKNTESPYPLQLPDNLKSVAFVAVEEITTFLRRSFCFGFARSVIL